MTLTDAIDILSAVDETLAEARRRHLAANDGDEFSYDLIEDFATIVYRWIEADDSGRLTALFAAVERILVSDDVNAQALVEVGLFEALQKRAEAAGASMAIVRQYFGPAANEIWGEHVTFWSGTPYAANEAMNDRGNLDDPEALTAIMAESERLGFTMASEPRTGSLLRTLASAKPGGTMLELGTGTGIATAWLLDGMDARSRLITVEQDGALVSVARAHLGGDFRVTFYEDDAAAVLAKLGGERFDLIFADTWAGKYTHLDEALGLLSEGGLYVVDDMLPQANWPEGHAEKARDLIAALDARADLAVTKLGWASGVVVAAKR